MRIGTSHQAGSDSLLTASTFFKMKELYFNDTLDDAEYNGKLYGLGQTFSAVNGITDPGRGGATIAEREDRDIPREIQNQSSLPSTSNGIQTQNAMLSVLPNSTLGGPLSTPLPSAPSYGPMSANGPYLRTTIGVGGR